MKTDNELIAEFMGAKIENDYKDHVTYRFPSENAHTASYIWSLDGMQYKTSWDWLMPVVEKIGLLYKKSDHDRHWNKHIDKLRVSVLYVTIQIVYDAVVEFIKWYNLKNK